VGRTEKEPGGGGGLPSLGLAAKIGRRHHHHHCCCRGKAGAENEVGAGSRCHWCDRRPPVLPSLLRPPYSSLPLLRVFVACVTTFVYRDGLRLCTLPAHTHTCAAVFFEEPYLHDTTSSSPLFVFNSSSLPVSPTSPAPTPLEQKWGDTKRGALRDSHVTPQPTNKKNTHKEDRKLKGGGA
jgi:hypothetical protein